MYQFIQMAYEYVRSSSKDEIGGESEIFLSKLSQIHAERLASIFADRDPDYGGTIRDLLQIQATRSNIDIVTSRHDKIEWESDDDLQAYLDQINQDENTPSLDPAYGTYLPIHFFLDGGLKDLSWGIYISEIGVYRLAAKLKAGFEAASPLSARDPDYLTLAYQILLRHELEHFKVESFALNAELFLKRPIYVRYLNDVYAETYHSSDCLEEALANAAVLNSTTIRRLLESMYPGQEDIAGFGNYVVQQVFFDQQQEACYRNYRLKEGWPGAGSAGGEARREAMNYLCNQIIHGQTKPPKHELIPLYAYPPDNHFLRQEELVPIHILSQT